MVQVKKKHSVCTVCTVCTVCSLQSAWSAFQHVRLAGLIPVPDGGLYPRAEVGCPPNSLLQNKLTFATILDLLHVTTEIMSERKYH